MKTALMLLLNFLGWTNRSSDSIVFKRVRIKAFALVWQIKRLHPKILKKKKRFFPLKTLFEKQLQDRVPHLKNRETINAKFVSLT